MLDESGILMSSTRPGAPTGEVPNEQIEAVGVLRFRFAKLCRLEVEPGTEGFDEAAVAVAAATAAAAATCSCSRSSS